MNSQLAPKSDNPSNAFMVLLSEINEGRTLGELSENLQKLVAAVEDTGVKGKIVYTVTVTPSGKRAVKVTDDVVLRAPTMPRDENIFFVTDENTLQRDNPKQRTLDLRTVEAPQVEARDIKAAAQ